MKGAKVSWKDDVGMAALGDALGDSVLVLDFWASWCGPCQDWLPQLGSMVSRVSNQGVAVRFFAINIDDSPELAAFVHERFGNHGELVVDATDSIRRSLGVRSLDPWEAPPIPLTLVVDREQQIRVIMDGAPSRGEFATKELEGLERTILRLNKGE
jgi:thiol-disulfide isomerase/thioredoxin